MRELEAVRRLSRNKPDVKPDNLRFTTGNHMVESELSSDPQGYTKKHTHTPRPKECGVPLAHHCYTTENRKLITRPNSTLCPLLCKFHCTDSSKLNTLAGQSFPVTSYNVLCKSSSVQCNLQILYFPGVR